MTGAVLLLLAAPPRAKAQPTGGDRNCDLTLQPSDSTRSVSRRVGEENYVTYLWNGMTWLCGEATMTADSAVRYETRRRLEMVGDVHYRDTVRDLRSRRLTYFQLESRVLAEDSVRLRQLETGAVLRGPRVEFYNAVRGEGTRRTVATERPRMRIPPPGDTAGDPFRVVADTAVFVGEEEAEAFGEVVVRRGQLTARGGYTRFQIRTGAGFLTRSPSVRGDAFTLTGDTIRVGFEGAELRTVRALGHGNLQGEDVEVRAERVDVRVEDDQVDELWAYGREGGRAFSAGQQIRGDSLHFAFARGRLTRLTAVGGAAALERTAADTVSVGAAPDTLAESADSAAGPEQGGETGAAPSPDSTEAGSAADSARGEGADRSDLDLRRNWITGDTVQATFVAAADRATAEDTLTAADTTPAPDSVARADSAAASDSAAEAGAAGDSVGNEIERVVAAGNARSFYRVRRDSAVTDRGAERDTTGGAPPSRPDTAARRDSAETGHGGRMARNYVIGDRITIRFRDGSPLSVRATRAIGLFLEPVEMPDSVTADTAPPADALPADSAAAAPPDSVPGDSATSAYTARSARAGPAFSRRRRFPAAHDRSMAAHSHGSPVLRRTGGMIYE